MQKVSVLLFLGLLPCVSVSAAETQSVVASIKPLHSLVQNVMGNTASAKLLIEGSASLHGFSPKPSQTKMLHNAKVIFYIDDTFEPFLRDVSESLPSRVRMIAVSQKAQLTILKQRQSGAWEAPEYQHGHQHRHHSDKEEIHQRDHRQLDMSDMHVWLDADNAKNIAAMIAEELSTVYPENRDTYQKNTRALTANLETLDATLKQNLATVKHKPFVVFHDAYQYFERRYGLSGVGAITLEPGAPLSINHLKQVREKVKTSAAACVFHEPQFPNKAIHLVTQENQVRIAPSTHSVPI